ncbi:hypothetical protein HDE_11467 [Halotydeus destructor]|nr:hypothetical protein HDE_11467 [Halotydeus destructor]
MIENLDNMSKSECKCPLCAVVLRKGGEAIHRTTPSHWQLIYKDYEKLYEILYGLHHVNTKPTESAICIDLSPTPPVADQDTPSRKRRSQSVAFGSQLRTRSVLKCPLCWLDFDKIAEYKTNRIMATRCGHLFCEDCLDNRTRKVTSCPTCNASEMFPTQQLNLVFTVEHD